MSNGSRLRANIGICCESDGGMRNDGLIEVSSSRSGESCEGKYRELHFEMCFVRSKKCLGIVR